ncbi:unnamed protein product [Alternaria alternata]
MAKSTSTDGNTQLNSTARYSLRKRPERSPTSNRLRQKKRVYRTRGGLVSLSKIPDEFISISIDHFFQSRKRAQIEAITTLVVEPLWGKHPDGKHCLVQILGRLTSLTGLQKLYLKRYQGLWGSKRIFDHIKEAEAAVAEGLAGDLEVVFVTLQGVGTEHRTILPYV